MSDMQIEVVANPVSTVPTAKGSYQVIDLAYKNKTFQDKLEGKKVMSFTNKDVFTSLQKASFGDVFNVARVKNDKGFWDWTAVSANGMVDSVQGASPSPSSTASPINVAKGTVTPKSNYETTEERAARQVLIVRQSSLSNAMEYATANKIKSEEEIIAMAQRFTDWVFNTQIKDKDVGPTEAPELGVVNFFEDMDNDFPK